MVFESLVVDLMNRYLGNYVERLDASQLNLGLLGGDAKLQNLDIKANAFDDLDLPVKVCQGHIGKLTLKIPFKALFTQPIIVELEDLYVLVVPNMAVSYNEEKERKYLIEAKQRELQKIEDAKKKAEELKNPPEEKKDTFTEKLLANVVKNVQITIRNIHIRYEDRFTNPERPFTVGVTLDSLFFHTVDAAGNATTIKDELTREFFKDVHLNSLSMYWNTSKTAAFYTAHPRDQIQNLMKASIYNPDNTSMKHEFVVQPLSAKARIYLHMRPETTGFTVPQMTLDLNSKAIKLGVNRRQYNDVTLFVDTLDRSCTQSKYRKYRPTVPLAGHIKQWWKFANNVILEETVKRRRRMWSWENMKQHRKDCRQYITLYEKKLSGSKLNAAELRTLEMLEEDLDVLNITLCRQQAEMRAKKAKTSEVQESGGGGGWFSGWFGGGKKAPPSGSPSATSNPNINAVQQIEAQVRQEMTPEEKSKLYEAIGYTESGASLDIPKEYVSTKMEIQLPQFSLILYDDELKDPTILELNIHNLSSSIEQRTSANAIKVAAYLNSMEVLGVKKTDGKRPLFISSQVSKKDLHLVDVLYETNPLDGRADSAVRVLLEPLEIVYDADTVNEIAKFFTPPKDVRFQELSAAVMASLDDVKTMTATSLRHIADDRTYTEINVDVKPSYILLPERGVYREGCKMLLVDLGSLKVKSEKTKTDLKHVLNDSTQGKLDYNKIKQQVYDRIKLNLSFMQILLIEEKDDWRNLRKMEKSDNHILRPLGFHFDIKKCIITNDPNLPKISIDSVVPLVCIDVSDHVVKSLLDLLLNVPFPKGAPEDTQLEELKEVNAYDWDSDIVYREYTTNRILQTMQGVADDNTDTSSISSGSFSGSFSDEFPTAEIIHEKDFAALKSKKKSHRRRKRANLTEFEMSIMVDSITVMIHERASRSQASKELLNFSMNRIGTTLIFRTLDQNIETHLGNIRVNMPCYTDKSTGEPVALIRTKGASSQNESLLSMKLVIVDKSHPEFDSFYKNTRRRLDIQFRTLGICLHQECLLKLLEFVNDLQKALQVQPESKSSTETSDTTTTSCIPSNSGKPTLTSSNTNAVKGELPFNKKYVSGSNQIGTSGKETLITQWAVKANMQQIKFVICSCRETLTEAYLRDLRADVAIDSSCTQISIIVTDLRITDTDPQTKFPTILWMETDENVFYTAVTICNDRTSQPENQFDLNKFDMSINAEVGKAKIVFLYKFVARLMHFLDNFKSATEQAVTQAQEMSQAAVQQMQKQMESPSSDRIALMVKLKAPMIFVPRCTQSEEALMMDLGELALSNSFERASQESKAIVETMTVQLQNLSLARGEVENEKHSVQSSLIKPVNLRVQIRRNLSLSWYTDIPNIIISCELKSIEAHLTRGDYTVSLGILLENLSEIPVSAADVDELRRSNSRPPEGVKRPLSSTAEVGQLSPKSTSTYSTAATKSPAANSKSDKPHTALQLEFTMGNVCLNLYNGNEYFRKEKLVEEMRIRSLARFELDGMVAKGIMLTNQQSDFHLRVGSCVLIDTRPGTNDKITKIVDSRQKDKPYLIDVQFTQDDQNNQVANVEICSIHFCVCTEYLVNLIDFFVSGLPQSNEPYPNERPQALYLENENERLYMLSTSENEAAGKEVASIQNKSFSLKAILRRPEFILVEDNSTKDTEAIILTTEADFSYDMKNGATSIIANVKQFNIFSSPFREELRERFKKEICLPTSLMMNICMDEVNKDMSGTIQIDEVRLNITPKTIYTISKVTASLSNMESADTKSEGDVLPNVPEDFWNVKPFSLSEIPFLERFQKGRCCRDQVEMRSRSSANEKKPISKLGKILVKAGGLRVVLESEVQQKSIPMFIFDAMGEGEVVDASGDMTMKLTLGIAVSYYNDQVSEWEPLLETYPDQNDRRWTLQVVMCSAENAPTSDDHYDDDDRLKWAKQNIFIKSQDNMELTLSKTALQVLGGLSQAFEDAYRQTRIEQDKRRTAPYTIQNFTGEALQVRLGKRFCREKASDMDGYVDILPGNSLDLLDAESPADVFTNMYAKTNVKRKISFSLGRGAVYELIIRRSEKRLYTVLNPVTKKERQLLVQVSAFLGQKTVTFMSLVQVSNKTTGPLEIYGVLNPESSPHKLFTLQANDTMPLPLAAVSSSESSFHIRDSQNNCTLSSTASAFQKESQIVSYSHGNHPKHFLVTVSKDDAYEGTTDTLRSQVSRILEIKAPLVFHNQLPLPVRLGLCSDELEVIPGSLLSIYDAYKDGNTFQIKFDYGQKEWNCNFRINESSQEMEAVIFTTREGYNELQMSMGMHFKTNDHQQHYTLFASFWILNKTGLDLEFKSSDEQAFSHPPTFKEPKLFTFRPKGASQESPTSQKPPKGYSSDEEYDSSTLCSGSSNSPEIGKDKKGSKKKCCKKLRSRRTRSSYTTGKLYMKVADSEWSSRLPTETVGSAGLLALKKKSGRAYEVRVTIDLSTSCLTKIVTFMPFYMVLNKTKMDLQFQELAENQTWFSVKPGEVVPFWPQQEDSKSMCMRARVDPSLVANNKSITTQPFQIFESHSVFMKLENQFGGLTVDVETSDDLTLISFTQYQSGMVLVKLVNYLHDQPIFFHQTNISKVHKLDADSSLFYVWDDPRETRLLSWDTSDANKRNATGNPLNKDDIGTFQCGDKIVSWVSFLDDTQRVVLFTYDQELAKHACQHDEEGILDLKILLSFMSMGLSLVDNPIRKEICYISITSSQVVWCSVGKHDRLKALTPLQSETLERVYMEYIHTMRSGVTTRPIVPVVCGDETLEVDLVHKTLLKPERADLTRIFRPSLSVIVSFTKTTYNLHFKLFRLQVDSQVMDAVFPVVLCPTVPPKSIEESKPLYLFEMSIVMCITSTPGVYRFKQANMLLQEMQLKLDQGFISALVNMFHSAVRTLPEEESFKKDKSIVASSLRDSPFVVSAIEGGKKSIFDNLIVQPIKIHVSFSSTGGQKKQGAYNEFMNLITQSVGVALTDVQDVVLKLAYFQRQNAVMSMPQLMAMVQRHYINQTLKQVYVLVFGLDVLGNPYGVLRGVAQGVEDLFYEPYKGAVLGPEEFAYGVVGGVRSLFEHTVGGAAGAASRITGTLGKGLAALTMDDDFQRSRREKNARMPKNLGARLAMGGQGIASGIFHGVTGVVTQPISGAKQEGVGGFIKGMGKGIVGVVARPVTGLVDFTSNSLEGLRQATNSAGEAQRIRPPRHIAGDGVIRPYNLREATGHQIMTLVDKGALINSDNYIHHVRTTVDKQYLLFTDKRIAVVNNNDFLGTWTTAWHLHVNELKEYPKVTDNGLLLTFNEKHKSFFGGSDVSVATRVIPLDVTLAKVMCEIMTTTLKASKT